MLRSVQANGAVCYGNPANWTRGHGSDRLIIRIASASAQDPQTDWYIDHVAEGLKTPAARFLFHFNADDLTNLKARITACYLERISRETMVAARYTYLDPNGMLWLRGAYVTDFAKGRRISPAMAATAFLDWHGRLGHTPEVAANVLVEDDIPNQKSVAALQKLGFDLTDQSAVVPLKGDFRDRHLLPFADTLNEQPCVIRRRMVLPASRGPAAISFLKTWRP